MTVDVAKQLQRQQEQEDGGEEEGKEEGEGEEVQGPLLLAVLELARVLLLPEAWVRACVSPPGGHGLRCVAYKRHVWCCVLSLTSICA